jgi:hypothetical protein
MAPSQTPHCAHVVFSSACACCLLHLCISLQAVAGSDGYTYNVLQEDGAKLLPAHLGHDSQAVDDQAIKMDADADMDADVAADDAAAAAEGAGGVGDSSWQEPGSGNMRLQQEQAISQMMTGLSMGGGAGDRGGAVRGVNASVLGNDMHAGGWFCWKPPFVTLYKCVCGGSRHAYFLERQQATLYSLVVVFWR